MKRLTLLACSALVAMAACKNSHKTETANGTDSTAVKAATHASSSLRGLYRSTDFSTTEEPLFLYFNFQNAFHVAGYDQHKGLKRNISGDIAQDGDKWKLTLREPGDHPFDGMFELVIDTAGNGKGTWTPNDKQLKPHSFTLSAVKVSDRILGSYEGDHSDITFDDDGSVVFNYYPRINDSTFEQQMITLRGSYHTKDTMIYMQWRNAPAGHAPADTMHFHYEGEGEDRYVSGVQNDQFELYPGE